VPTAKISEILNQQGIVVARPHHRQVRGVAANLAVSMRKSLLSMRDVSPHFLNRVL